MNVPLLFAAAAAGNANKAELLYVWEQATPEAKVIIFCLVIFSIVAWSVMIAKALQMRKAKRLNQYFNTEYRTQKNVLDVFDRRVQADGCQTHPTQIGEDRQGPPDAQSQAAQPVFQHRIPHPKERVGCV